VPRTLQHLPITTRFGLAYKAFRQMMFPTNSGVGYSGGEGWFGGIFGLDSRRAAVDNAGPFHQNATVAACLRVIEDNAPQPKMEIVETLSDGDETPMKRSPVLDIFRQPNPYYDYYTLCASVYSSLVVDGNSYLLKIRSASGIPVELWWVPSWTIFPRWPVGDPTVFIDHYEYRPGGNALYHIDPADIIHFRYGKIDERNDRLMISPLRAAGRKIIGSLNDVDNFTSTIMAHNGVPPIVIRPTAGNRPITRDDADAMTADYRTLLSGERKGDPFIATGPFEVVPLGWNPDQMAMNVIPARLEDQVCSLTGVPATLAGLTSGAQHKTYQNVYESRRSFYEETLIPLQDRFARAVDVQLLGDPGMGDPATQRVRFSYKMIQCMQEDQGIVATRVVSLYQGGVYTRGQALRALGDDATKNDELYVVGRGQQFLRVGEEVPPFQAIAPAAGNPNLPEGSGGGVAPPTDDGAGSEAAGESPEKDAPEQVAGDAKPPKGKGLTSVPALGEREDGADPFLPATASKAAEDSEADPDPLGADETDIAESLLKEALEATGLSDAYRDGSISDSQRRTLLAAVSDASASRLKAMAQDFLDSHPDSTKSLLGDGFKAGLAAWAAKAKKTIGGALLAGALALFGPKGLPPNEQAILARANAAQAAFMDNFVADVGDGGQPLTASFPARAALYGRAVFSVAENLQRASVVAAGTMTQERRILAIGDHCTECPELADLGWQPLDSLPEIGSTPCGVNCRCHFEFQ
jgi:HK97 family phage portal protein